MASTLTTTNTMTTTFMHKHQPVAAAIPNNVGRSMFGLKSNRGGRIMARKTYTVTLVTPNGKKRIKCPDNDYILNIAEDNGIDLPYTCRAGACSSCVGIIKAGTVNQDGNSFLDDEQINKGFVLTCVAIATSDCTIETHKENDLF